MVKLKHYVSKATLISVYYSLIYPSLSYACTLWGNNYNAPLSQIVKLQNKAVRVINDVPLMESITPHYTSLSLLKFPDIVKLNTCMLFMIISTMKSFLIYLFHQYLNYIITVPAVHHPIKLQYLYFELILGDFAPALLEVSFGTIFRNPLETNHLKKCLEKHFCAGTLLNTNETLSLL